MQEISSAVRTALETIDRYYTRVPLWYAHLYDPVTGGFYMSQSGVQDPDMAPGIEMTCWGLSFLKTYTLAFDDMPSEIKARFVDFFCDRQNPESGIFIDKQGPANPREQARNQAAAKRALDMLSASPRYPLPSGKSGEKAVRDRMPAYMESPESYIEWVKALPWDHGSWTAGDQTQSSQQYLAMLPDAERRIYTDAVVEFLNDRQFESGLWSPDFDFNAASGAFKVGLVYSAFGMRLPNPERIVDSIFRCYRESKTTSPYFVRNPISVMNQMADYSPALAQRIKQGILDNIDAVTASFGEFLCPDGAFSARKGQSMISFGGVVGSHGLFEGDIDATAMMLIARRELYQLLGLSATPLDASSFWAWVSGKEPIPPITRV